MRDLLPETLLVARQGERIYTTSRKEGQTLKTFAQANGFKYRTVSDVVRGLRVGNYGEGRDVRLKLGLPVND